MIDNNKLRDTIMDMEASLSTNLSGYSMWHYGEDIHGITRETLKNAVETLKAKEPVKPNEIRHGNVLIQYQCPACASVLCAVDKYCSQCGRAVKWDA